MKTTKLEAGYMLSYKQSSQKWDTGNDKKNTSHAFVVPL